MSDGVIKTLAAQTIISFKGHKPTATEIGNLEKELANPQGTHHRHHQQ